MGNEFMRKRRSTAFENCIEPLLKALKWRGNLRTLKESLPHFTKLTTITSFCDVMKHLRYDNNVINLSIEDIDSRLFPCLMVTKKNEVMVLISREGDKLNVFDGITKTENSFNVEDAKDLLAGATYLFFKPFDESRTKPSSDSHWLRALYRQNKSLIFSALFLSLVLNLLILATPLFIMTVYDRVIGTSSYTLLNELGAGIVLALIGMYVIYRTRSEQLALFGARCDKVLGDRIFSRLLYLAPIYTETATAGAQVSRIKDFDRVREAVSGPMLTVFFDLPFIVISIAIIAVLGGMLVIIPVVMVLLYFIMSVILSYKIKRRITDSSETFANLQEFLLESIENIRVVKYTSSVKKWGKRYREKSAQASLASIRFSMYSAINIAVSELIMIGSGMLVLAFGAVMAMDGSIGIGAMLAIMILIWRVLTPIRSIFNTLPRVLQIWSSLKQIDRLMSLPEESSIMARVKKGYIDFNGDITFQHVSLRYPAAYTPSLLGVTLNIPAGKFVAVVGRNGSGKSTLLKVVLGLYQPQAGGVLLDGRDIRQINPLDLRASIGYLPQQPELFYGTISANLRLGDPTASDAKLRRAASSAGILEEIIDLPDGFESRLSDQSSSVISSSFRQSLCLARAYLRESSILLLDEPGNTLDMAADQQLMRYIGELKGETTVVMVTHRPSHLSKADHIILMDKGQVVLQGEPAAVLEKIPLEMM